MANNIFERYRPSGGIRFLQFWHCVWYSNVGMIAISCRSQPWSETGISIRSNVLANGCHQCALCLLPCISKSVPVSCSYPQQCTREWLLQLCSRRLLWHRKWVLSICSYLQQYIIDVLILVCSDLQQCIGSGARWTFRESCDVILWSITRLSLIGKHP